MKLCDSCLGCVDLRLARQHDTCPVSTLPSLTNQTPTMIPLAVFEDSSSQITAAVSSNQPILEDSICQCIDSLIDILAFGSSTPMQLASMDPIDLVNDPIKSWKSHGWAFVRPNQESCDLASEVMAKVNKENLGDQNKGYTQSIIAGEVRQTVLKSDSFINKFHDLVRKSVKQVAPNSKLLEGETQFSGAKVLVVKEGEGTQPLHFDSINWKKDDHDKCVITALFYANDSDATLLPVFPADRFHNKLEPQSLPYEVRARLLNKRYFFSARAPAGTLLLFRHSVPHAGVAATALLRVVMFDMLSKKNSPDAEQQYFEWCYVRDAFGDRSKEYYSSLEKNFHHDPFNRFGVDQKGKADAAATKAWFAAEKLKKQMNIKSR